MQALTGVHVVAGCGDLEDVVLSQVVERNARLGVHGSWVKFLTVEDNLSNLGRDQVNKCGSAGGGAKGDDGVRTEGGRTCC